MYTSLNKTHSKVSPVQQKEADRQRDNLTSAGMRNTGSSLSIANSSHGQIFSKRSTAASSHALPASNILQKQKITMSEAKQLLQERAPGFKAGSKKIRLWDTDWEGSNCHGYTYYREPGYSIDADTFLQTLSEYSPDSIPPISLFFRGTELAHSGKYAGGILTHLLIDIGILQTTSDGTETFGYDRRFNLPEDIERFYEFIAPINVRNRQLERVIQVTGTFSDRYQEWLKHFDNDPGQTEKAFNHIYDIKDQLENEPYSTFYLEGDAQYLEMEDFVRTLS